MLLCYEFMILLKECHITFFIYNYYYIQTNQTVYYIIIFLLYTIIILCYYLYSTLFVFQYFKCIPRPYLRQCDIYI